MISTRWKLITIIIISWNNSLSLCQSYFWQNTSVNVLITLKNVYLSVKLYLVSSREIIASKGDNIDVPRALRDIVS